MPEAVPECDCPYHCPLHGPESEIAQMEREKECAFEAASYSDPTVAGGVARLIANTWE